MMRITNYSKENVQTSKEHQKTESVTKEQFFVKMASERRPKKTLKTRAGKT